MTNQRDFVTPQLWNHSYILSRRSRSFLNQYAQNDGGDDDNMSLIVQNKLSLMQLLTPLHLYIPLSYFLSEWEENIKVNVQDIVWVRDWIHAAQLRACSIPLQTQFLKAGTSFTN
jgi:hypothetical protein